MTAITNQYQPRFSGPASLELQAHGSPQTALPRSPWRYAVVFICFGLTLTLGCSNKATPPVVSNPTTPEVVASPATQPAPAPVAESAQDELADPQQPQTEAQPPSGYAVDAMIGQANGNAIYASTAFETIEDQLAALGRSRPPAEFRQRAMELIVGRLRQLVTDALILGEAERGLSAPEHAGLLQFLKQRREELIRFWGRGSVAVAEDNLLRHTSRNLEETVRDAREQMLVQRYLQQTLFPRINVTRKRIERYYYDHQEQYAPPASRTLRLIRVKDADVADRVDRVLAKGKPFQEVATRSFNQYRATDGGLMSEEAVGDEVFGEQELNQAMLALEPGEHTSRIEALGGYVWVYVDAIDRKEHRSLRDAQLEIDSILRRQQFQTLTELYRRELYETGSYNSIENMSLSLLEIAVNRYGAAK